MTAVDDRRDLDDAGGFDEPDDRGYGVRPPAREVNPASPLADLARKRAQVIADLHLDLAVPDYLDKLGVDLYVRFKPIPVETTTRLGEQAQRSKNHARFANINAAALAAACVGIYYLDGDGDEHAFVAGDPDGPWPVFDEQVAATIGVPFTSPTRLVRDFYFTDDQITATVEALNRWSQGEVREREQDSRGN